MIIKLGSTNKEQVKEIQEALFLISNEKALSKIRKNLLNQRGKNGAAEKLSYIIMNSIKKINQLPRIINFKLFRF